MQLGLKGQNALATRQRGSVAGRAIAPRVGGVRRAGLRCNAALSAFSGQRVMARPAVARRAPGRARGLNCKAMWVVAVVSSACCSKATGAALHHHPVSHHPSFMIGWMFSLGRSLLSGWK